MNVAEVVTGIHRLSPEYRDKALRQAESLFSRFVLLPLDHRAALMAGELLGELWNKGMAIETMDGLIAATALANGYNIIVTRNAAHFSNIKGLKAERY